jgi:phage repressor protein C with HTH and peptisase S24 domain
MEPTMLDGDWLLVDPYERPALGDLAVARDGKRLVLKRVVDIDDAGRFSLGADNPDHAGQRLGPLEPSQVIGRPWFRYGPRRRFGPLD